MIEFGSYLDETTKTKAPCLGRRGTINIPSCSWAVSTRQSQSVAAFHQEYLSENLEVKQYLYIINR